MIWSQCWALLLVASFPHKCVLIFLVKTSMESSEDILHSVQFSSLVLCLANSNKHDFPNLFPRLRAIANVHLVSVSLCSLETLSRKLLEKGSLCFYSCMANVQSLKTVKIYFLLSQLD